MTRRATILAWEDQGMQWYCLGRTRECNGVALGRPGCGMVFSVEDKGVQRCCQGGAVMLPWEDQEVQRCCLGRAMDCYGVILGKPG